MNDKWIQPCPYCNRDTVKLHSGSSNLHIVFCVSCALQGPAGYNKEDAIRYWNRIEYNEK